MFQSNRLSIVLPAIFALLWASSYVTARIGLNDISPILFVAIRLAIAAPLMVALVVLVREPLPPIAHWPHLLIGGALVHGVTQAPAHVALIDVSAAPMALVHAFHPVLTAAIAVPLLNERFTARQWTGMALGLIGVVLAFPFAATEGGIIALVGLSLAGLTGGTLYLKRFSPKVAPFPATAIQLIGGAIISIIGAIAFETPHVIWTSSLMAMMGWNIVMISIFGMAIYSLMLMRGQAGRAASAFFIVPGSAALMGWIFLNQTLNPLALTGLTLASFGVWLVWRRVG
jgi:drug/metabolite transporter (DMT)-like permease